MVVVVMIISVMMVVVVMMAGHCISDCRAADSANDRADRASHDSSAHGACNPSRHSPALVG